MKLSADDQTNFPKLTHYLRHDFPLQIGNTIITSNLRKFGSLSLHQARSALMWDIDPLVVITDLDHDQCGPGAAFGCTSDSTQIEIDDDVVNEFEQDANANLRLTAFGRHVFLTGVTLLHEMCHWGNFLNGVAETDGDAGEKFETAVYGGVVD
jgi:Metallopeptidase toxin 3